MVWDTTCNQQRDSKICDVNLLYKKMCMITNETTLQKRLNDTEINNYRSPYGLQQ